ncbi:MAG: hypothetical protein U1F11_06190 [Steroidobacteraceae bacterium]
MIVLFSLAIANVHRPALHKRLMYSLMCAFMIPALALRVPATLAPPGALEGGRRRRSCLAADTGRIAAAVGRIAFWAIGARSGAGSRCTCGPVVVLSPWSVPCSWHAPTPGSRWRGR